MALELFLVLGTNIKYCNKRFSYGLKLQLEITRVWSFVWGAWTKPNMYFLLPITLAHLYSRCHPHQHYSPRAGLNSSNFLTIQGTYRRYNIIKCIIYSIYCSSGWSTPGIREVWHNLCISTMVSFNVFFAGSVSNIIVVPSQEGPHICSVDVLTSFQALATA